MKELITQSGETRKMVRILDIIDLHWPHGKMCLVMDDYNRPYVAILFLRGINGNETWVEFDPNEPCYFPACEHCA